MTDVQAALFDAASHAHRAERHAADLAGLRTDETVGHPGTFSDCPAPVCQDRRAKIASARSLTPQMVAEARAGLRSAENCDLNRGSARLCGACAATLVYAARLVVEAADA